MRYLNFNYYDDNTSFVLQNESDELANLLIQFFKLKRYELSEDLIVSHINKSEADRLEIWIEEMEEYFSCVDDEPEVYEVFNKIKEMIIKCH